MKYLSAFFFLSLIPLSTANGQATFSKIIDLFEGVQDVGLQFEVIDDKLTINSIHFCNTPVGVDNCSGISRFDFQGEQLEATLIENYNSGINGNLTFVKDSVLYILGLDSANEREGIPVLRFNLATNEHTIRKLAEDPSRRYIATNVLKFNKNVYISGVFVDTNINKGVAFINKWNSDLSIQEQEWEFFVDGSVRIGDVIPTLDSNLVFVAFASPPTGSELPEDRMHIVKIDTLGNVLNDFRIDVSLNEDYNLSMDKEGNFYTDFRPSFDRQIAKINSDLDSILWTVNIPQNPYADYGQLFQVDEIINTSNGDVLVCGTIDYLHLNEDPVLSSYVIRISKEGEILWHKILTNSNNEENIFNANFRRSILHQVKELPDGFIAGVGQVLQPVGENLVADLWLLIMDENGCIVGFDCEKDIYVLNDMESFAFSDGITSARSVDLSSLKLRPNPVYDHIYIDSDLPPKAEYRIYNLHGILLQSGQASKTLNIADMSKGIYFLHILDKNQIYSSTKIIKQ